MTKLTRWAAALVAMLSVAQAQGATLTITLNRVSDSFSIEPELVVNANKPVTDKRMVYASWQIDAGTLTPVFATDRFECIIFNKTNVDGCREWRGREDDFVHVNRFQSGYGDTPAQREANARKSSVGRAAVAVAGGVLVAPVAVMMSPFLLLGKVVEPETRKWVEFNHDKFNEAVTSAVRKVGFADIEAFKAFARRMIEDVDRAEKLSTQARAEVNARILADKASLKPYVQAGLKSEANTYVAAQYTLSKVALSNQADPYFEQEKAKIEAHYQAVYSEFKGKLAKDMAALEQPYQVILAQQAQDAKVREQQLEAERAEADRQASLAHAAEVQRQAREAAMLADFRRSLKVGDSTFCGYVIESRPPMVRLALNTLLPGYPSELWVRVTEVFPPVYGCLNRNGRISPNN